MLLDSGALHASYINKDVALVLKDRIDGKAIKSLSRCVVSYGSAGRKEHVDLALRLTLRLKPRSDIQGDKGGSYAVSKEPGVCLAFGCAVSKEPGVCLAFFPADVVTMDLSHLSHIQ